MPAVAYHTAQLVHECWHQVTIGVKPAVFLASEPACLACKEKPQSLSRTVHEAVVVAIELPALREVPLEVGIEVDKASCEFYQAEAAPSGLHFWLVEEGLRVQ